MNKTNKFKLVIIFILILLIFKNIVFATDQLSANQFEFNVKFSGNPTVSNKEKVIGSVINSHNALIHIIHMNIIEDTETVSYIVQNTSRDLYADLIVNTTITNPEFFEVDTFVEKTRLTNGEATKVTFTVRLIKNPVGHEEVTTIKATIDAIPIQPGSDDENDNDYDDDIFDDVNNTLNTTNTTNTTNTINTTNTTIRNEIPVNNTVLDNDFDSDTDNNVNNNEIRNTIVNNTIVNNTTNNVVNNNDNNDNNDNNSDDSNNGNDNSNTDKNKGEDKLVIDTSSPSSVIITIYDYYQKDETPKTGIFSFIDIFRRY